MSNLSYLQRLHKQHKERQSMEPKDVLLRDEPSAKLASEVESCIAESREELLRFIESRPMPKLSPVPPSEGIMMSEDQFQDMGARNSSDDFNHRKPMKPQTGYQGAKGDWHYQREQSYYLAGDVDPYIAYIEHRITELRVDLKECQGELLPYIQKKHEEQLKWADDKSAIEARSHMNLVPSEGLIKEAEETMKEPSFEDWWEEFTKHMTIKFDMTSRTAAWYAWKERP